MTTNAEAKPFMRLLTNHALASVIEGQRTVRKLLLIALPYIAISLSACDKVPLYTTPSGEENASKEEGNTNTVSGSKSPGNKIDACAQITREEVEAALDGTVMEPTRGDDLMSRKEGTLTSSCMFGSDEGFVSLDIKQQNPASTTAWNAARSYEELKELIIKNGEGQSYAKLEEVTGLGAAAFAQTSEQANDHETTDLRVLVKRFILTIRVSALASTPTLEVAKILAGKVIPRLETYGGDAIVATPSTTPKPAVKLNEDERLKSEKGSQVESKKSAKRDERATVQKATKAASARGDKRASRRANESSPKSSQKSANRTVGRNKKETAKPARPSPKNRRRP